jgi:hypothetical protein
MTCDQMTSCDHGGFHGSNAPDVRGSTPPSNLALRVLSHGEMPKTDGYETRFLVKMSQLTPKLDHQPGSSELHVTHSHLALNLP